MQTGWLMQEDNWFYLNPNGLMVVGEAQIDGVSYTFGENGVMVAQS